MINEKTRVKGGLNSGLNRGLEGSLPLTSIKYLILEKLQTKIRH